MEKKEWQQPSLEVLEVSMTAAGAGTKTVDWVSPHDADLYS
ncbi:paeninodin family lasso peptide [Paenibacillus sedimenti]|uniref:Paeninodin family lasso peptide n=1 Tax=Paenibacillus sedimenti TaxID=2770274 RepID=A0A926KMY9_9BACL|nr:paeninodin family lasso peptide [Paenibacillus sedimenti]MBD0379746.1 paeninodin family lasso peptide [Paenibacillus sedimenti]